MKYITAPFRNYFNINGKASSKEFWIFLSFYAFIIMPSLVISNKLIEFDNYVLFLLRLFFLIPVFTIGFRRLNDTKFSKWLFLVPFINLILASFPSEYENNRS
jgi:uncharacterized membrane protein YhaH (DUF805 family)